MKKFAKEKKLKPFQKPSGIQKRNPIQLKNLMKNRIFLASVAVVLSALTVFGGGLAMDRLLNSVVEVARVKEDLPAGTAITADMLKTVRVGKLGLAPDTIADSTQLVGYYAVVPLFPEENVTARKVSKTPPYKDPQLYQLPEGQLALSVSAKSLTLGLAGKLKEGDVVTVFAQTFQEGKEEEDTPFILPAPLELQYLEVLAVTTDLGTNATTESQDGSKSSLPSIITLVVNQRQARILAALEQKATIHFALATRDVKEKEKLLLQQKQILLDVEEQEKKLEGEPSVTEQNPQAKNNQNSQETGEKYE